MAKKDKFLLVSLQEAESKKLAQVISNDTSRKILDYLADKEGTESAIAKELGIPISTVHYNLQALVKGQLVEAEEFHYSSKGKEVLHYKLANQYIIIAPKSTWGIKEKLRTILPVFAIAIAGSVGVWLSTNPLQTATTAAEAAPQAAVKLASEGATFMAWDTAEAAVASTPSLAGVSPAIWFLCGCLFTLLLLIAVDYMNYRRKK